MTHLVLEYTLAEDYLDRRTEFRSEHLERAEAAVTRGELVLAGALSEPFDRALYVFEGNAAAGAQAFAEGDPYVRNGLVTSWQIRTWNTVIDATQ